MLERVADAVLGLDSGGSRVEVDRDIPIPMPDGAVLLADRLHPAGLERGPVVLVRTPYGRRTPAGWLFSKPIARRGLQVVLQSVRGTFGSGGEFWPFHQEKDDGIATLRWLREQPWCDGRVAMAGASYVGHTQWAVGPYADPPLEAMCLGVTASDFGQSFYPGGAFCLDNLLTWSALVGTQERVPLRGLLPSPQRDRRVRRSMSSLPLGGADRAAIDRPVRFWQDVTAHAGNDDGFWKPIDHGAARRTMTTPTSMVTGWYDLFITEQLRDFQELAAGGCPVRITVGPWAHSDPAALRATVADQASWLSARLRGTAAELYRAPVRLYLQRSGRWLDCDQWPPAEARPSRLHLHPGQRLRWDAPQTEGEPDRFRYDPADPTPGVGGLLLSGKSKQQDNRAIEARQDVLVYTGDPVPEDLDLVGEVSARIHLRSTPGEADLFVRLCDVDERGVSRNVCDGIVRLRPGYSGDTGARVRAVDVVLSPTAYRFRRGHRLRVQVSGGAFPRFARNHGTGDPLAHAVRTTHIDNLVYRDGRYPSYVELPVLSR